MHLTAQWSLNPLKNPKSECSSITYESLLQRKKRRRPYTNRVKNHAEMIMLPGKN